MVRSKICSVRAFAEEQVATIKLIVPICYRYIAFRNPRVGSRLQPMFDMFHRDTKLPAQPMAPFAAQIVKPDFCSSSETNT